MTTFTSTLPEELLAKLEKAAKKEAVLVIQFIPQLIFLLVLVVCIKQPDHYESRGGGIPSTS